MAASVQLALSSAEIGNRPGQALQKQHVAASFQLALSGRIGNRPPVCPAAPDGFIRPQDPPSLDALMDTHGLFLSASLSLELFASLASALLPSLGSITQCGGHTAPAT